MHALVILFCVQVTRYMYTGINMCINCLVCVCELYSCWPLNNTIIHVYSRNYLMNSYITLLIDLIDWLKLKFYSLTHVTLAIVLISVVFNSLLLWYYSGVGDYNGGPWWDTRIGLKEILIKTKKLMFFV